MSYISLAKLCTTLVKETLIIMIDEVHWSPRMGVHNNDNNDSNNKIINNANNNNCINRRHRFGQEIKYNNIDWLELTLREEPCKNSWRSRLFSVTTFKLDAQILRIFIISKLTKKGAIFLYQIS